MSEKEYIERKAAQKVLADDYAYNAAKLLDTVPTADVQEVRHGKWIEKPYLLGTSNFCSLCLQNFGMPHGKFNFCPNCGAKMDKESE